MSGGKHHLILEGRLDVGPHMPYIGIPDLPVQDMTIGRLLNKTVGFSALFPESGERQ